MDSAWCIAMKYPSKKASFFTDTEIHNLKDFLLQKHRHRFQIFPFLNLEKQKRNTVFKFRCNTPSNKTALVKRTCATNYSIQSILYEWFDHIECIIKMCSISNKSSFIQCQHTLHMWSKFNSMSTNASQISGDKRKYLI